MRGIMILGTDTDVGKTVCTAVLAAGLTERGFHVGIIKPFTCGGDRDPQTLRIAAGVSDPLDEIAPNLFADPVSPHLAAERSNEIIDLDRTVQHVHRLGRRYEVLLMEGVGGLLVPLTRQTLFPEFMERVPLPVVVVARTGVGTINHTLLTIHELQRRAAAIAGIVFNRIDPTVDPAVEQDNMRTIADFTGVPVLGRLDFHIELQSIATNNGNGLYDWRKRLCQIGENLAWEQITCVLTS